MSHLETRASTTIEQDYIYNRIASIDLQKHLIFLY